MYTEEKSSYNKKGTFNFTVKCHLLNVFEKAPSMVKSGAFYFCLIIMNINKKIIMINAVIKKSFFDIIITPLLEDSVTPNKLNILCINYNIVSKLNQCKKRTNFRIFKL